MIKNYSSKYFVFVILFAFANSTFAADLADIAKARQLINVAMKVIKKYKSKDIVPALPQPIDDSSGKFILPYTADGEATPWVEKALNAKIGAAVGAKAGGKLSGMLGKKIPMGGLMSKKTKEKTTALGAVTAIGGWDFIKKSSNQSFKNLADYAVFMHLNHSGEASYNEALAAAMALYPKLETSYKSSIDKAYRAAKKKK